MRRRGVRRSPTRCPHGIAPARSDLISASSQVQNGFLWLPSRLCRRDGERFGIVAKRLQSRRLFLPCTSAAGWEPRAASAASSRPFVPATEIYLLAEAVKRVFDQYGNRKNRYQVRLRFLIEKLGLEGVPRTLCTGAGQAACIQAGVFPTRDQFPAGHPRAFEEPPWGGHRQVEAV